MTLTPRLVARFDAILAALRNVDPGTG